MTQTELSDGMVRKMALFTEYENLNELSGTAYANKFLFVSGNLK